MIIMYRGRVDLQNRAGRGRAKARVVSTPSTVCPRRRLIGASGIRYYQQLNIPSRPQLHCSQRKKMSVREGEVLVTWSYVEQHEPSHSLDTRGGCIAPHVHACAGKRARTDPQWESQLTFWLHQHALVVLSRQLRNRNVAPSSFCTRIDCGFPGRVWSKKCLQCGQNVCMMSLYKADTRMYVLIEITWTGS